MSFIDHIQHTLLFNLNSDFDIPIIQNYQSAPEPQGDYAALGVTTVNKLNRDTSNFYKTDEGFAERVKQEWRVLLSLDFYGNSAYDNAFKASSWLASRTNRETLQQECMSVIDVDSVRRIPELRDTGYIQRCSLDFSVLAAQTTTTEVDWFETVRWKGTVLTQEGNIVKQWESYANWTNLKSAIEAWVNSSEVLYNTVNYTLHENLYSN